MGNPWAAWVTNESPWITGDLVLVGHDELPMGYSDGPWVTNGFPIRFSGSSMS